jgi:hypothetical protein
MVFRMEGPITAISVAAGIVGLICWNAVEKEGNDNANLIAAAPDLLEACKMLEVAEEAWANCEDCGGEGMPEACGTCFPAHDDARIKRRIAIAKAESREPATDQKWRTA